MPRQWQKLDYEHGWAGLVDRRQRLDYGPAAFSLAQNAEFFGGTPAKRLGSQYVNGWGTITVEGSTATTLKVQDSSGFSASSPQDTVTVYYPDGVTETATISSLPDSVTVVLTGALSNGAPTAGAGVVVRRQVGSPQRIDGLHQATFRSGFSKLLASANGFIVSLDTPLGQGQEVALIAEAFPETTIASNWGSTSTGPLTSAEGLAVGDRISIDPLTPDFVTVQSIVKSTHTIVVSPSFSSAPLSGQTVRFFPKFRGSDTHFTQYGNTAHVAQDPRVGTEVGVGVGATPPRTIREDPASTLAITRNGVQAPTHTGTVPAAAANGAGNLTGDYSWRVKFRDSLLGRESEPGPEITVTGLSSNAAQLTNLPVSVDPTVDVKDVYRTLAGGSDPWFFVGTVANATTTFDDDVADAALGRQMREFLDTLIPDSVVQISNWPQANRLIGVDATANAVVYSDQPNLEDGTLKGESWPVDNTIFVSFDDGDQLLGVLAFYDSVLVFKSRSIFRIIGVPPDIEIQPVSFRQDQTAIGTFNIKAIAFDQNEMVVPAEDGVYLVRRYEGDVAGFTSQRMSRQLDKGWAETLNVAGARRMHAVFFRQRRQYRVFIPIDTDDEPTRCYTFQFDGGLDGSPSGWSQWDFQEGQDGGINVTASHTAEHDPGVAGSLDVTYIGTDEGDIIALDHGAAERGAFPFTFDLASVWIAPAGKGVAARGRALDCVVSAETDTMLELGIETQFRASARTSVEIDAEAVGFFLDISQLGVDAFGPADTEQKVRMVTRPDQCLGEYHRIRFRERSADAIFRLQNWTYWFQALEPQMLRQTVPQAAS